MSPTLCLQLPAAQQSRLATLSAKAEAETITAAETGDAGSEIPDSQAPESSRLSDVGAPTDAASDAASIATEETAPQETEPTLAEALEKTAEAPQAEASAATEVVESTENA